MEIRRPAAPRGVARAQARERLAETLKALNVRLDEADLARIERSVPPDAAAGTRYDPAHMQILDSERRA